MTWFDTHCHLDTDNLLAGQTHADVLARARDASVTSFMVIGVGETLSEARQALALSEANESVWAAIGVHPHDAKAVTATMTSELEELLAHPKVLALGEIGLDYHYEHSDRAVQKRVFEEMIGLARKHGLPIVVHTREAAADTLEILEGAGAREVGGIIHCFSEDVAFARRALELNFDLSFSGILTFKNAATIAEVAAFAPLDRIHLETDSPYLAPVPFRGKRCEPAMLVHTARRLASLRGISEGDLAEAAAANARRRLVTPTLRKRES